MSHPARSFHQSFSIPLAASRAARAGFVIVAAAAGLALLAGAADARTLQVRAGQSIQDAVDAAGPGGTVIVHPGIYTAPAGANAVVSIHHDDFTLIGRPGAVIDASGVREGIAVGAFINPIAQGCPEEPQVRNFRLQGFTVRDADHTGVRLNGVDGYRVHHGIYLDNALYGPYPVCSWNGRVDHNFASGHTDAAIYVGNDIDTQVDHNVVTESAIAIEVSNSVGAQVHHNVAYGNTSGILIVALAGRPITEIRDVQITHNLLVDNNLPNPRPTGTVSMIPSGTGILNVGGKDILVEHNTIVGHGTQGLAMIGNPFGFLGGDPAIDPFLDENVVRRNTILDNGFDPDPLRAIVAADVVFIPDVVAPVPGVFPPAVIVPDANPFGNCFAANRFASEVVFASLFPGLAIADLTCP